MTVTTHLPGHTWAAAHRMLTLVIAGILLLAALAVSAVLLLTVDSAGRSDTLPRMGTDTSDTCFGAPIGTAC